MCPWLKNLHLENAKCIFNHISNKTVVEIFKKLDMITLSHALLNLTADSSHDFLSNQIIKSPLTHRLYQISAWSDWSPEKHLSDLNSYDLRIMSFTGLSSFHRSNHELPIFKNFNMIWITILFHALLISLVPIL